MARKADITAYGIDGLVDYFKTLEDSVKAENERAILLAGAAAAEKVWSEKTRAAGHVDKGRMVQAIGHTEPQTGISGTTSYVYPLGEADKGVKHATKAFIINSGKKSRLHGIYGRHKTADSRYKGTRGDKYITGPGGIEATAVDAVHQAMAAKLKELQGDD